MPFRVDKKGTSRFMLFKLKEGTYAKRTFKSREAAIGAGIAWMKYHRENPYVEGNFILARKK